MYWGFRDSIKILISSKIVIFGHNLGTAITNILSCKTFKLLYYLNQRKYQWMNFK